MGAHVAACGVQACKACYPTGVDRSMCRNVREFKKALAKEWEALPWCFETSSKSGSGRSELLGYIASLRQLHLSSSS